jgi:hypothetical protein
MIFAPWKNTKQISGNVLYNMVTVVCCRDSRLRGNDSWENDMFDVNEKKVRVYHASTVKVENPVWNYAAGTDSERNDFGLGFYVSTDIDQPLLLLCERDKIVLNQYELNLTDLKIKQFGNDDEWLLTVIFNRRNFNRKKKTHEIRDRYRKAITQYDVVIGAIANDRMFSTINAFIENNITDKVAIECLKMMQYQPQIVLKSEKACSNIIYTGSEIYDRGKLEVYRRRAEMERATVDDKVDEIKEAAFRQGKLLSEIIRAMEK